MGGGGRFIDFDVTRGQRTSSSGLFGSVSQATMDEIGGNSSVDSGLLPLKNGTPCWEVNCFHKHPIVCMLDVTGSMGSSVYAIYDRLGSLFIEIERQNYLSDPAISFAAVGDAYCDRAPIQVCQFSQSEELITFLQKIWIEHGGGGQSRESYELMLYYYARHCILEKPEIPFLFIIGDEGFYPQVDSDQVLKHFGDDVSAMNARQIFKELKKKFHDNVFLLHLEYGGGMDHTIVEQWQDVLDSHVIALEDPTTVVEVMLGIIAMTSRSRDLEGFSEDLSQYLHRMQIKGGGGKTSGTKKKVDDTVAKVRKMLLPYSETITAVTKSTLHGALPQLDKSSRRRRKKMR